MEDWSSVKYWKSENYLVRVVQQLHPSDSNSLVYRAAASGAACVRQSLEYEDAARTANMSVRPLLLYYAFLNWLKSFLHILDLSYPSSASLLQHGVSVRRTKRNNYQLPSEMIYVYKNGVLPSTAILTGVTLPSRLVLGDVLGLMPDMNSLIAEFYPKYQHMYRLYDRPPSVPSEASLPPEPPQSPELHEPRDVTEALGTSGTSSRTAFSDDLLVSRSAASNIGQTVEEWVSGLVNESPMSFRGAAARNGHNESQNTVAAEMNEASIITNLLEKSKRGPAGYLVLPRSVLRHPRIIRNKQENTFFATYTNHERKEHLPVDSGYCIANRSRMPDWVNHFVMLYCLSALVRYNPLEWSEIIRWHNEQDALIVEDYLSRSEESMRRSLESLLCELLRPR